jgi:hypothetical protein
MFVSGVEDLVLAEQLAVAEVHFPSSCAFWDERSATQVLLGGSQEVEVAQAVVVHRARQKVVS